MSLILKVEDLNMNYNSGGRPLSVLQSININIEEGETVAITGPSGSGKTTLMGLCAALDNPSSGDITLLGTKISPLNEDERAKLRNRYVGFIFQNFQLLPSLTAIENVMLPLELQGVSGAEKEAVQLLERVGLKDRVTHYPSQLSGGEQQRVAIARAIAKNPLLLLCDEPTGALDDVTGRSILSLLDDLNRDFNKTVILITHNAQIAEMTDKIIHVRNGLIDSIVISENRKRVVEIDWQ